MKKFTFVMRTATINVSVSIKQIDDIDSLSEKTSNCYIKEQMRASAVGRCQSSTNSRYSRIAMQRGPGSVFQEISVT
jgi:hypothetical protein